MRTTIDSSDRSISQLDNENDFSKIDPLNEPLLTARTTAAPPADGGDSPREKSFPIMLMRVLDDQRDDRTVLSWLDDGKAFEIRNVRELESDILPEAFDFDPSFRFFQRKLNRFGFVKGQSSDPGVFLYSHEKFVKGNLDLCKKISPVRNVSSRASSTQAEDDMIESAIQVLCFIFPAFKVFIQMFSEVTHIQVPLWPIATSHLFMCVMYYLVVVKKKKVPVLKRLLRILSSSSSMRQIRNAN